MVALSHIVDQNEENMGANNFLPVYLAFKGFRRRQMAFGSLGVVGHSNPDPDWDELVQWLLAGLFVITVLVLFALFIKAIG